jgi:dTMP kinase
MPGRFVSLEGIDGSGKSTQARMLAPALRAAGRDVVETREPGGTILGEAIRGLLLDSRPGEVAPAAEIHLFAASRAQHVAQVIRPALARGTWVVSDRFVDSSLAYQGAARGFGIETVLEANRTAVDGCLPELTLVIDVPPATAAWRRSADRDDRIEAEGAAFQAAVAEGFRELARRFPERVVLIDGAGEPDAVHALVMQRVGALA